MMDLRELWHWKRPTADTNTYKEDIQGKNVTSQGPKQ